MVDLPVNVAELTPEVRQALQDACSAETSRQNKLDAMPTQAVTCTYEYWQAGGDPQVVADAVKAWADDHQEAAQ